VLILALGGMCAPALAQKMVFASYMVTNQDYQGNTDPTQELKIAAYEREIQQAQAWVEIITWNNFIDGSYVSPIDDPNKYPFANFLDTTGVPSSTLGYFHSHQGATALLPYFIRWYKTGECVCISPS
jgi:glycosyl hydrolase family 71